MNDYEKGWIEAAIDGEGTITIGVWRTQNSIKRKPMLRLSNNSLSYLLKAKRIIGGGIIYRQSETRGKNWGQNWILELSGGARLRDFLPKISLDIKEAQRLLVLEALALMRNAVESRHNREQINHIARIRLLHRKGKPLST